RLSLLPGPLVAVVALTAVAWGFDLETPTLLSRYGSLSAAIPLPTLSFFDLGLLVDLLPSSAAVAILASVESLLSGTVADGMARTSTRLDPDRELFGQGVANIVAPIMGGIPATAAIARTGTGVRNGARSRWTGVFHSITVLVVTLVMAPLAGHIPLTVLAGILIFVAWNIADV